MAADNREEEIGGLSAGTWEEDGSGEAMKLLERAAGDVGDFAAGDAQVVQLVV